MLWGVCYRVNFKIKRSSSLKYLNSPKNAISRFLVSSAFQEYLIFENPTYGYGDIASQLKSGDHAHFYKKAKNCHGDISETVGPMKTKFEILAFLAMKYPCTKFHLIRRGWGFKLHFFG